MKRGWGVLAAVVSVVGLSLVLLAQTEESGISIGELRGALTGMETVDAASVSEGGTFFLFSDYLINDGESGAPYPMMPTWSTGASFYSLGDGRFLVDDLDLMSAESFSMMSSEGLEPPGEGEERGGEGDSGGETNCLVWPVNLSELTLATNVPEYATFFLYQDQTNGDSPVPYPMNPCSECLVYALCVDDVYLVDDTGFVWPDPQPGWEPPIFEPSSYASGTFWIEITNVSGGVANLILHGTESGVSYTIEMKDSLSGTWSPEAVVTGATDQDWTPANVTVGNRAASFFRAKVGASALPLWLEILPLGTNAYNSDMNSVTLVIHNAQPDITYEIQSKQTLDGAVWATEPIEDLTGSVSTNTIAAVVSMAAKPECYFRAVASNFDTDGGGLPDWWQLQYFGHIGVDPYADADNDGWNNLQEFSRSTNPITPNAPPTPRNVIVRFDSTGTNLVITWESGGGPVSGYTIYRYPDDPVAVGSDVTAFTNALYMDFGLYDFLGVEVLNSNGTSSLAGDSAPTEDLWKDARIVRGATGQLVATLLSPSTNLADVRFLGRATQSGQWIYPTFDVPISAFNNGVAVLTTNQTEGCLSDSYFAFARGITTGGEFGGFTHLLADTYSLDPMPQHHEFADASPLLKQNLQFLLRSATVNDQFSCRDYYEKATNDYAYAGYASGYEGMRPAEEHFLWRNFLFDPVDGIMNWYTGAGYSDTYDSRTLLNPKYRFPAFTNPPPLKFTLGSSSYIYYRHLDVTNSDPASFAELGLVPYTDGHLGMRSDVRNAYGLPINGVQLMNSNLVWTISPGGFIGPLAKNALSPYFANVASPNLQTVSYYFNTPDYLGDLPGDAGFSAAKTTPLMVAGWGSQRIITSWAKQAILNGYTNRFAYLQQYFDKAYKVDASGAVTAQETGILSPFGEFFPTEPGSVALVTRPDIETGQRGTGIVHAVKIQFDVNHDGIMDLSLSGPDNTSENGYYSSKTGPFVFWANNDYDRGHTVDGTDSEEDDLGLKEAGKLPVEQRLVDGRFTTNGLPAIPSMRDLEDYARMWIPGLSNLMAALPTNYTVQLASDYVPIRVFRAVEPDGGTDYLFDEVTASNQVANSTSLFVGETAYNSPIGLNGKTNLGEHFIFCASEPVGYSEPISLRVFDEGQNYVGGTTAYIQIKDVKDMYERWTVGERPSYAPTNVAQLAVDSLPYHYQMAGIPFQYPYDATTDTNTPYILFVHGWNMETWEKDRYAETAFKRLYWQGYQGRFGGFRWPTDYGFGLVGESRKNPITDPRNYDNSEYNAWRSATGLLNLLGSLNNQYLGNVFVLAHSMGNVVASEAFRLAGTNRVANTYVASQAAIPAHTYDNSVPDYSFIYTINFGPFTPNIYKDWFLSNSGGVGRRINFHNTNDYALSRGLWELDQMAKPDTSVFGWTYGFDGYPHAGYPNNATNHYAAGVDDAPPWNWFFKENFFGTDVYLDIVNVLTNRYEVMAYAAQARSTALGRTPTVHNITGNVDLARTVDPLWPPDPQDQPPNQYSRHKWHSAEFRSTNMRQKNYWQTLLYTPDGFNLNNP